MALPPQPDSPVVASQSGHGMSGATHVPWFNPREMDDATVLQLNTGRCALLQQLYAAVHDRVTHPGTFSHWLLTGTRGAGKSFFLRLVQAGFAPEFGEHARFVLLPEEHRNIYSPHELLAEIERMLSVADGAQGVPPTWRVKEPSGAWAGALSSLLGAFHEPLLVVGVENFDHLLAQAFSDDTDNARLRHLMSNQPRIMLVATAVQGTFDENYSARLFRQFEHHAIPGWDGADHRDYLERRAQRSGQPVTPQQLARIDAYSRYTGGNARAAAVLAGSILESADPLSVAGDLDAAIEKMSDYYRALIDRIPPQTRKLLDALIRGGDPASQSEIAQRIGAQQNEISRAFAWLVDQGYVGESRLPGAKAKQYRVQDRLLVQFYRMRSVSPGQRSKLALMADLLADTLLFKDKWSFAHRYANEGHGPEARTLAELALRERMVELAQLPATLQSTEALCAMGKAWAGWDAIAAAPQGKRCEKAFALYPSDADMQHALAEIVPLAMAIERDGASGSACVPALMDSIFLSPVDKLLLLVWMLSQGMTKEIQMALVETVQRHKSRQVLLENAHPAEFARFRGDWAMAHTYPRTVSLDELSALVLVGERLFEDVGLVTAAEWAAQAALVWSAAQEADRAVRSLNTCIRALAKLSGEGDPGAVLAVCGALCSGLGAFPAHQQALVHSFMGEAFTLLGEWTNASAHNKQAYVQSLAAGNLEFAASNLGQCARNAVAVAGADADARAAAAWDLLDAHLPSVAGFAEAAFQQLGGAVADIAQRDGEAAGFALGRGLLNGLAKRPHLLDSERALRALWVDMVGQGVAHGLLRDLLEEWPQVFDHPAHPSLGGLSDLLRDWLGDLETPAAQRPARRLTLDPDLATTLTALEANLSSAARARFGLPDRPAAN